MTVDLHCHILPSIDDGAADLPDSLAMARQGAEDGLRSICATPHIRHDHDVRIHELGERTQALNAALHAAGIPVAVIQGGEVAETAVEGLDDAELAAVALGDGDWILLEPAPGPLSNTLDMRVAALATRGFRSLIAHPERHPGPDMIMRLRRLTEAGALVQATADFLVQPATAPLMLGLAERGLIHVLGSDAHSARVGREVRFTPALEVLAGVERLRPHIDWIRRQAPEAIVGGTGGLAAPFEAG